MEIITKKSDVLFAELLGIVQKDPTQWMCVHINLASVNEKVLDTEGISKKILEKMHQISLKLAERIFELGLNEWAGKIFCYDDGDIIAVVKCPVDSRPGLLAVLDEEFTSRKLQSIVHNYPMEEKFSDLLMLSSEKQENTEKYRLQMQDADIADKIFQMTSPDVVLTREILKKRRQHQGLTILIIEDDIVTRGLLASALKEYKIIQAKDAKSGISAYVNHAPNMVLLDIHLPDYNGHEVLEKLKLMDPQAYVVMLSADSIADNVLLSRSKGSAGFIKKPFSKERIMKYIALLKN